MPELLAGDVQAARAFKAATVGYLLENLTANGTTAVNII
jgi:hypothetical protein